MSRTGCLLVAFSALASVEAAVAAEKVTISLVGQIPKRCVVGDFVEAKTAPTILTPTGSREWAFAIDCNTPFSYALLARHGSLRRRGLQLAGTAAFTDQVPYVADLFIPLADGNREAISDRCTGEQLYSGRCGRGESGSSVSMGQSGKLGMSWSMAGMLPVAGDWVEILEIQVGVRP